jgi:hypothetical protein
MAPVVLLGLRQGISNSGGYGHKFFHKASSDYEWDANDSRKKKKKEATGFSLE